LSQGLGDDSLFQRHQDGTVLASGNLPCIDAREEQLHQDAGEDKTLQATLQHISIIIDQHPLNVINWWKINVNELCNIIY